MFHQLPAELKEYGIFVVRRVMPHNNVIPDSYVLRVGTIKLMPERACGSHRIGFAERPHCRLPARYHARSAVGMYREGKLLPVIIDR